MARIETITMSMREIERLKTIQAVVDGNLKPMLAAIRLSLTTRQIQRLVNRCRRGCCRSHQSQNHAPRPPVACGERMLGTCQLPSQVGGIIAGIWIG